MLSTRAMSPTPHAAPVSVSQHQQAPDAVERNDDYSAALAARARESADSSDRKAQLVYGQMLARFNDLSPDAQDRNIELSSR
jgi:hypothetical protein